jgi:inosine/xanthosine triphosphatase
MDTHESFEPRRIIVGSKNPVKIAAVASVLGRIVPGATVSGLSVRSGVSDQPWGDDETISGARSRALAVLAQTDADLAVGLEGGVVELLGGQLRTCAWAVACARDGREGVGGSMVLPLPDRVAARLRAGEELSHAMDAEAQTQGTGVGVGAVGILTAGLFDRQRAYEVLVGYALAPFLAPAFYR